MRKIVFQGTRETIGDPHSIVDHTAAVFDELFQGAHRGALRIERLQRVAMGKPQCEREGGICGVVLGPTRCEGFARPRQRQRIDGEEGQKVLLSHGGDQGPLVACEADGKGWAVEPRAQRADPRVDSLGRVREDKVLSFRGASRLQADIMFAIGPVDTDEGSKFLVRLLLHVSPPRLCESCEKGQACLRSAKAL